MTYNLTYKPFGESAVLIEWPARIDDAINEDIIAFDKRITTHIETRDTIIAYHSLTVLYCNSIDLNSMISQLKVLYNKKQHNERLESKTWEIPVCYDTSFGLDLDEIASAKNMSIDEVIDLHTTPKYRVFFIGFQPGFMYLGGLDERIHVPRKENPRLRISKGSVGIGGPQTGIYPQDSAGGWNIIGKSPIPFFEIDKPELCFAKAGDRIQFKSISLDAFYKIEKEVAAGSYQLKSRKL